MLKYTMCLVTCLLDYLLYFTEITLINVLIQEIAVKLRGLIFIAKFYMVQYTKKKVSWRIN